MDCSQDNVLKPTGASTREKGRSKTKDDEPTGFGVTGSRSWPDS